MGNQKSSLKIQNNWGQPWSACIKVYLVYFTIVINTISGHTRVWVISLDHIRSNGGSREYESNMSDRQTDRPLD